MYSYDENGNKVQLRMEEEKGESPLSPPENAPVPQMKKGLDSRAKFAIALICLVGVGVVLWYFQDDIRKMFKSKSKSAKKHHSASSSAESGGSARSSHSSDAFNF